MPHHRYQPHLWPWLSVSVNVRFFWEAIQREFGIDFFYYNKEPEPKPPTKTRNGNKIYVFKIRQQTGGEYIILRVEELIK